MKKIIVLISLLSLILLIAGCNSIKPNNDEIPPNPSEINDTTIEQPNNSISDETDIPGDKENDDTTAPVGGDHAGDELYPLYFPVAGILSTQPGDDSFMGTKAVEVAAATHEFLDKYSTERSSSPPLVYYVIHKLNLTRDEVEYYYRNSNVTSEYIDALFCTDEEEAKTLLKSPYAFKIGENLYNVYDMLELVKCNPVAPEVMSYLYTEDFYIVCANTMDYLGKVDPNSTKYSKEIFDFVNKAGHGTVDAGDELLSPYSGYVDGVVLLEGTFSENYYLYMEDFDEMEGKWEYNRPAVMYHLAGEMNLTREDLEVYYTALGAKSIPENIYAGLLAETLEESMQLLKNEYAFYNNGKLYTLYDVYKLDNEKTLTFNINDDVYESVWKSIDAYLKTPTAVDVGDAMRAYVSQKVSAIE